MNEQSGPCNSYSLRLAWAEWARFDGWAEWACFFVSARDRIKWARGECKHVGLWQVRETARRVIQTHSDPSRLIQNTIKNTIKTRIVLVE